MATHDQALSLDVTAPPLDPDAQEGPPGLLRARQAGRQLLGLLLRHAAGAGWQVPSPGQALARGPQGAPRFGSQPGDGGWHLGLSHSAGHVGAVLGWQVAVGVDVDQPVPGLDWSRLAAHHFHPAEQWSLMRWQGHQRDREALKLWCAKEAVLKAQGVGLHGQLDQVLIVAEASMDGVQGAERAEGVDRPREAWQAQDTRSGQPGAHGWSQGVEEGWLCACALGSHPVPWTRVPAQGA